MRPLEPGVTSACAFFPLVVSGTRGASKRWERTTGFHHRLMILTRSFIESSHHEDLGLLVSELAAKQATIDIIQPKADFLLFDNQTQIVCRTQHLLKAHDRSPTCRSLWMMLAESKCSVNCRGASARKTVP